MRKIVLLASVALAMLLASGLVPKSNSIDQAQGLSGRPNILFIQTDDLDMRTYEMAMPSTQQLIGEKASPSRTLPSL